MIYDPLNTRYNYSVLYGELMKKSWCIHAEPPTVNTKVIEEYLGKYICRIGLSKNRFHYDQVNNEVTLSFKDYRHKDMNTGEVPIVQKKLHPLVAIDQIMQHCLPAYFQKNRYYGLHASASYSKNKTKIPQQIRNNKHTVRSLFQIIKAMLGVQQICCDTCQGTDF